MTSTQSTLRRAASLAAFLSVLAGTAPPVLARQQGQATAPALQATLEVQRPYVYEGEPLLVRVMILNTRAEAYPNAGGLRLLDGIRVAGAARGHLKKRKADDDPRRQPSVIAPNGFFGIVQDVASLVQEMKPDTYTITWEGAGIVSEPLTVKVIPRFEPDAGYVAVMETDYGYLEFELLSKSAPRHVQNFYDLALRGFYDNTVLHQVIRGVELRGGDQTGTGSGWPIYTLARELSRDLKHRRGTLSMLFMPAAQQDHGSQFVITLSPVEGYDGALSIFGQLRKGDEALTAIESVPTTGQYEQPFFRPLKPVTIKSVTVRRADGETPSAPAGE